MYIETKPIIPLPPQGDAIVRVHKKGLIFSRGAGMRMGITTDKKLCFITIKSDPSLIYVAVKDIGYKLVKRGYSYHVNNTRLARAILALDNKEGAIYRLGEREEINGESYYNIITRQNFYDERK